MTRIDTNSVTYQDLLDHPELLERLERQARAERAAVVDELVLWPVRNWLKRDARATDGIGAPVRLAQG